MRVVRTSSSQLLRAGRIVLCLTGLLLAGPAQAQSDRCRFIEHYALVERGLAEGQACHTQYLDCLAHPVRDNDPIHKTRCMQKVRCLFPHRDGMPHYVSGNSNLELFRLECEPE